MAERATLQELLRDGRIAERRRVLIVALCEGVDIARLVGTTATPVSTANYICSVANAIIEWTEG